MGLKRNELISWKKYFDIDYIEYDVDHYNGEMELIKGTEKFKTMRYPYLVVNQMTIKVLSEPPKIFKGEEEIEDFKNIDLRNALASTLGYGEIVVIPFLVEDEYDYDVLPSCDTEYIESNGKLVSLKYSRETTKYNAEAKEWENVIIKCEHIVVDNLYTYKEDDLIVFERRSYDMAPFLVRNQNVTNSGLPIYATATGVIKQLDSNDFERAMDRELSRKEVMYPTNMIEKETRRSISKVGYINRNTRKYRIVPGTEGAVPIFLDGNFQPEKYILDQNQFLHMLSMHCGFGSRYFSYDADSGLKTATEVVSDKSDLYQSKKMHDKTLKLIIDKLIEAYFILSKMDKPDLSQYEVIFSDNIIEDEVSQRTELKELYELGAIDQRTLLEAYNFTEDEINKVMAVNKEIEDVERA